MSIGVSKKHGVKLKIDDTFKPWRELQIIAHIKGNTIGYLDLQRGKTGPYPSMISVAPAERRRGVASALYQEAAKLACERFGQPLHSDVERSGADDAFWQKQVGRGLAVCVRKSKTSLRKMPFEHIIKGRNGCVRYRFSCPAPIIRNGEKA